MGREEEERKQREGREEFVFIVLTEFKMVLTLPVPFTYVCVFSCPYVVCV